MYYAEDVTPELFPRAVRWCSGCSAEQAIDVIEAEFNGQWVAIDIGANCLTRLKDDGRVEE